MVIGNGNVALDVARMLALTPEELAPTDTTDAAIEAITRAGIREILVVGRRGPAQAAWTPVELGELGELAGADILVDPAELELDPASAAELEAAPPTRAAERRAPPRVRAARARGQAARDPAPLPRARPSRSSATSSVEAVELVRNELVDGRRGARRDDDARRSRAGSSSAASATAASRSRACRSTSDAARSRTTAAGCSTRRCAAPGVYCAGWIKRGPSGVIGTNKKDATETVELLLEDARAGRLPGDVGRRTLERAARRARRRASLYAGWEAIDAAERGRGEPQGRPRVKLATWDELLEAAASRAQAD